MKHELWIQARKQVAGQVDDNVLDLAGSRVTVQVGYYVRTLVMRQVDGQVKAQLSEVYL